MSSEGNFLAEAIAGSFSHFTGNSKHPWETFCITQERFGQSQETFSIWQGNLGIRRTLFLFVRKVFGYHNHLSQYFQARFRNSRRKNFDDRNFKMNISYLFDYGVQRGSL